MSLSDLNGKLNGVRMLRDPMSDNVYFVMGQNPYYEPALKKRVKCGLGHQMWVNEMNYIICNHSKCDAKIKLTSIK